MVYIKNEINDNRPLLEVKQLVTRFRQKSGDNFNAVDGIDLTVNSGEIHGIVGESGSGKTITALSVLNLLPGMGAVASGQVFWQGRDLSRLSRKEIQAVRGAGIAMIFQNPQQALNPLYTIGQQLISVIKLHQKNESKTPAKEEALKWLKVVRLREPEKRLNDYPHQMSGGMCQRVVIALALACRPKLLIADEPTASLDLTIQHQIIDLLMEIRETFDMAMLVISHDLGVIAEMCDRVSVMYLGKILEQADVKTIYKNPSHPYTKILLDSILHPEPEQIRTNPEKRRRQAIGDIPEYGQIGPGCRFRDRCPSAFDKCIASPPFFSEKNSQVACWLYDPAVGDK